MSPVGLNHVNAEKISRFLAWGIILGACALGISLAWPTFLRDVFGLMVGVCSPPGFALALLVISAVAIAGYSLLGRHRVANACRERPWTATGLALVGGTHVFIIAASAHLFLLPPGSSARPMGLAVASIYASIACVFGVGVISIISRERGTLLWVVMVIGALATFFDGPILLQIASRVVGFEISD